MLDEAERLNFNDSKLDFFEVGVNVHVASAAADFIRQKLLPAGHSFTFEPVMSSSDIVILLEKSRGRGYRTYLYLITHIQLLCLRRQIF